MNRNIVIKHRDWLEHCSVESTLRLIREGKMPKSIEGWMLTVSLRQALRAVYGSNIRAGWCLLSSAIWDKLTIPYHWIEYSLHKSRYEQELRALDDEIEHLK